MRMGMWKRVMVAVAAAVGLAAAEATARGSEMLEPGVMASATGMELLVGQRYMLHLHHLHTGESLDVTYRIGNMYLPDAMSKLNHLLRDQRTQD